MFEKVYELPLTRNYVRHWGIREAVRELLQNALDSSAPLEWAVGTNSLTITSRGIKLEPKTLLLGATSKADDPHTIGSFGEGYKIALLVLARDGYRVTVTNSDLLWTSEFKQSRSFGEEVLTIMESKNKEPTVGLTFHIEGIQPADLDGIIEQTLPMQSGYGEILSTSFGEILLERPKQLYVNGLFVCETEFRHGYNFKPEHLQLERDRQTVSTFNLAWKTKDMWFETEQWEIIVGMMEDECPDTEYADYSMPELLKETCYRHFLQKNPGKLIATSQKELQRKVEAGLTNTVYIGGSYGRTLSNCPEIVSTSTPPAKPSAVLAEWLSANRKEMRTGSIVNFKALIQAASAWTS